MFFLSRNRKLMAVSVKAGAKFEFTAPTALFETQAHEPITAEEFFTYDASVDGQHFLINVAKVCQLPWMRTASATHRGLPCSRPAVQECYHNLIS
jgi:hypothetical protein